jgi:hypothetical protein
MAAGQTIAIGSFASVRREERGLGPKNTVKTHMFYARRRVENLLKVAGLESSRTCA